MKDPGKFLGTSNLTKYEILKVVMQTEEPLFNKVATETVFILYKVSM